MKRTVTWDASHSEIRDIYEVYREFLSGEKLDVGRRIPDISMPTVVDRTEYLRLRSLGKQVLHVGCLDHPEIILEKAAKGTWLHNIVSGAADFCMGIDVNRQALEVARRRLGVDNIQLLDLSQPLQRSVLEHFRQVSWDLILCPETLEHVTNHEQFLRNLRSLARENTTLVITGPNAFSLDNFIGTCRGFEAVNTDHKYWFTFYTLSRALAANKWHARRLIYYDQDRDGLWRRLLHRAARRLSRAFSDGLIIEATPAEQVAQVTCNNHNSYRTQAI